MSALTHAKQPENTKSPELQPQVQQAGPASNMEALGMLGMSALGQATSALTGAGPQSLEEEVAVMAQTSPGMLPVLLDALPDIALQVCLPQVMGYRAVRDWLLGDRPDLLKGLQGGAELLIDGMIPVGHSLKVSLEAELDMRFKLAGANSVQLTRSAQGWQLVFDAEVAAQAGVGAEEESKNVTPVLSANLAAGASADLGVAHALSSEFSSDLRAEALMQALGGELDLALLKSLLTDTLTSLVPDSVSIESAVTADVEAKGSIAVLGQISPALQARLAEVKLGFEAGLSGSRKMTVSAEGVTNEFVIEASSTIGPTLKGLLPMAKDLYQVAKEESWKLTVVFVNDAFQHIRVDEDMNDMISERIFTDPKELLNAQSQRFIGVADRLNSMAAGMSVTVREALPEAEYPAVTETLQSLRLAGTQMDCDYELQQTVSFAPGAEVPEYMNTSNFAGSDLALLQAIAQLALTGEAGTLNLGQKGAQQMLEIQPIRLVGSEEGSTKTVEGKAEVVSKLTHSFDVPYNGPTKLF
jgi:hypothetical protein